MSTRVLAWVFHDVDAVRGHDRLVLLALADEADDYGGNCHPSLRRLAHKARVAVGTASEAVRRLESSGHLVVERPERTGRGRHNRYRVVVPWADDKGRDGSRDKGSGAEHSSTRTRGPGAERLDVETRGNARPRGDTDPQTLTGVVVDLRGGTHQEDPQPADFESQLDHLRHLRRSFHPTPPEPDPLADVVDIDTGGRL